MIYISFYNKIFQCKFGHYSCIKFKSVIPISFNISNTSFPKLSEGSLFSNIFVIVSITYLSFTKQLWPQKSIEAGFYSFFKQVHLVPTYSD